MENNPQNKNREINKRQLMLEQEPTTLNSSKKMKAKLKKIMEV